MYPVVTGQPGVRLCPIASYSMVATDGPKTSSLLGGFNVRCSSGSRDSIWGETTETRRRSGQRHLEESLGQEAAGAQF